MSTDLVAWVNEQLDDSALADEAKVFVLAALEGDEELASYLDTGESSVRERVAEAAAEQINPGGTFLSSVTVEGFRGIGPTTTLSLAARPGLTIVAGRNGSGKSSISEALELVLTGDTYRWKKRTAQWKDQWRNLHHPTARVAVEVVEEASGPVTVMTSWADNEPAVTSRTTRTQRKGQKQQDGLGDLGWQRPLEQFRPILSYDELGGMLEGSPSELHDAIAKVLGTEQLSDALKRIQVRLKQAKGPGDEATKKRKELVARAASITDERAVAAAGLLRKTSPDLAALRALATGLAAVDNGPLTVLRRLTAVEPPTTEAAASQVAMRLRRAVAELAEAGSEVSQRQLDRLELLERALEVHETHGDMPCPVCHSGRLDETWATTNRAVVREQRSELELLDAARQTFRLTVGEAHRLLQPRPTVLNPGLAGGVENEVTAAREAWDLWASVQRERSVKAALDLADHVEKLAGELAGRVAELRRVAAEKLAELDDEWQPLATQIGAWSDTWEHWLLVKDSVDQLASAENWLKDNDLALKNLRLTPIREGAKAAWARLRQESNVEIGNLALSGVGNRRTVRIEAEVDGQEANTLAVLSQGELHALALSLFLPRARMAASPFRFVVLDDPVQAMDPAKVDGLVELLSDLARTHQVVVLSHDDRLPAAVRRADVSATILEVTRGKDSRVTISTSTDPATRYLSDAFAIIRESEEDRLAEDALRRTLPGLLRFAAEAAARDRYFSRRLLDGAPLSDVEAQWQEAATTRQRVALAVFGEPREHHELDAWATAPYRKLGLKTIGSAMHAGLRAGILPRDAARDVERLIEDLRTAPA